MSAVGDAKMVSKAQACEETEWQSPGGSALISSTIYTQLLGPLNAETPGAPSLHIVHFKKSRYIVFAVARSRGAPAELPFFSGHRPGPCLSSLSYWWNNTRQKANALRYRSTRLRVRPSGTILAKGIHLSFLRIERVVQSPRSQAGEFHKLEDLRLALVS